MGLRLIPLTLKKANEFVEKFHRHSRKMQGHKFSLGLIDDDTNTLCGVCIVGRPISRWVNQVFVCEVSRLATDGTKTACSMLYGAAARTAKAMGYLKIQTYILESEPGTSLKAAGWKHLGDSKGAKEGQGWSGRPDIYKNKRGGMKSQKFMSMNKQLWGRTLNPGEPIVIDQLLLENQEQVKQEWI